jgi:gamma-carbonic anhydrase
MSYFVHERAYVTGNVELGNKCSIWPFASVRGDVERITIGSETNIQDNCVLHTSKGQELIIGSNVSVGHGAVLHSCTIHDNCLIGIGAIVLDKAVVKSNTIIAAGAVVTPGTVVESDSLYAGVPAKKVRDVTSVDRQRIVQTAKNYVKMIE